MLGEVSMPILGWSVVAFILGVCWGLAIGFLLWVDSDGE